MKKLRLTVEALEVESFTVDTHTGERGTIKGRLTITIYATECQQCMATDQGTACLGGCSTAPCDFTGLCDTYTCPGGGGECNKPSEWYNPCQI